MGVICFILFIISSFVDSLTSSYQRKKLKTIYSRSFVTNESLDLHPDVIWIHLNLTLLFPFLLHHKTEQHSGKDVSKHTHTHTHTHAGCSSRRGEAGQPPDVNNLIKSNDGSDWTESRSQSLNTRTQGEEGNTRKLKRGKKKSDSITYRTHRMCDREWPSRGRERKNCSNLGYDFLLIVWNVHYFLLFSVYSPWGPLVHKTNKIKPKLQKPELFLQMKMSVNEKVWLPLRHRWR